MNLLVIEDDDETAFVMNVLREAQWQATTMF